MRIVKVIHKHFRTPQALLDTRIWCGCRIRVDLQDSIQASLYYRGLYEPETTALLRQELRPGDCFVDVGANVGYYTFLAACLVGPAGTVHAIEPSRALARRLAMDVDRNRLRPQVVVYPCAAADYTGDAYLRHGWHEPTPDGSRFIGRQRADPEEEQVPVSTLDRLLSGIGRVDVLKIDVEGSEVAVIRGAAHVLSNLHPRLVLAEVQATPLRLGSAVPEDVFALLRSHGYVGFPYESPYHAPMVAFRLRGSDQSSPTAS